METIDLQVELRQPGGKGAARAIRRAGKIPCVLYGPKRESVSVALDSKAFETRVAALEGSHLIRLQSPAGDLSGRLVLVKEVQRNPVTQGVLHADLYEVDVHRKIELNVPLHFVGKAAGVELGGILQPIRRSVEVLCLPLEIPEYMEVDVTQLGINDAIHISELKPPTGVEILFDADVTLVTVSPPVVEEVKVAEGEEAEVAVSEEAPEAEPPKP